MDKRLQFFLGIIVSAVIHLYLYTFIHEGGHALVAIMNGGRITRFVIGFNAHVSTTGASFTPFTASLFSIAGVLLPIICLIPFVLLYRRGISCIFYHCLYFIIFVGTVGSTLAWVIIPIVAMLGTPPAGDDVTSFLASSGLHPILITIGALLVAGGLIALGLDKGIFQTYFRLAQTINKSNTTS